MYSGQNSERSKKMQESDQKALGAIQIMDCAWHFSIGLSFHKP